MHNLNKNKLAFETMLENAKQINNGNPFKKLAFDILSYKYNRTQYNDCFRHINEENNQIASIYNQINQLCGLVTQFEQQKLQRHIQLRSEYDAKSMKHFLSGGKDAESIVNKFI